MAFRKPTTEQVDRSDAAHRVALLITFQDALGLGILMPLIPFMVLHFGGAPALVTQTLALYSLAAFIGSLLIGRWGDRIGFTPVVLTTLALTLASTLGILLAWSLAGVFLFRILTGFLTGRSAALRAMSTVHQPREVQAARMASLSTANVLGIALGPTVPGLIGLFTAREEDIWRATLVLSLVFFMIALITAAVSLPRKRTRRPAVTGPQMVPGKRRAMDSVYRLRRPLAVALLVSYAQGVTLSVTALLVSKLFGWGAATTGWMLAGMAAAMAVARLAIFRRSVARFGLEHLLTGSILIAIPALVAAGSSTTPAVFIVSMLVFSVAASLANIVPPTQVAAATPPEEAGAAQGVAAAVATLGISVSAAVNGLLFQNFGVVAPYLVGAAALLGVVAIQAATSRRTSPAATLSARPVNEGPT